MHLTNKNTCAPTPPMGWNSYDYYDTTVDEAAVKANADYMAKHLKAYGWEYIVVDIQWYAKKAGSMRDRYQYIPFSELEMDEYSRLLPDPERFPSSADGSGFKRDLPEGQLYYDSLLELYASWGVDYIKCDDICNTNMHKNPFAAAHEIEMLSNAIQKCGRPIVLSLSPGPALIEKAWFYEKHANLWRITDDFWDNWAQLKDMFQRCELWQSHVSAGCYPDCDMLPLGELGKGFATEHHTYFTPDEQKTMMTLWCLFGSPLMLGAEMTLLDDDTLALLTNTDILAMLPPSVRPHQITRTDNEAVWYAKDDTTGTTYVALFNLSDAPQTVSSTLADADCPLESVAAKELWSGKALSLNGGFSASLAPHACSVCRFETR